MNCNSCNQPLSSERLEAVPDAVFCVPCLIKRGDVPAKKGYMYFCHKTAGEIEIVDDKTLREMNRLDRRGYNKGGRKNLPLGR